MKTISLGDMLTDDQILRAITLAHTNSGTALHTALRDEIVVPNLPEIDQRLGQKNDPDYLAYAIEYVLERVADARGVG